MRILCLRPKINSLGDLRHDDIKGDDRPQGGACPADAVARSSLRGEGPTVTALIVGQALAARPEVPEQFLRREAPVARGPVSINPPRVRSRPSFPFPLAPGSARAIFSSEQSSPIFLSNHILVTLAPF